MKLPTIACIALIFLSCHPTTNKSRTFTEKISSTKKPSGHLHFELDDNCKVCDSCETVIIAEHTESTDSGDIQVDSGIVYIPNSVVKALNFKFDSLRKNFKPNPFMTISIYKALNSGDINFLYKSDFSKLWKDTVKFKDFSNPYRLKGKIIGCETQGYFPRLLFKIDNFNILDATYLRQVEKKLNKENEIKYLKEHGKSG